MTTIYFQDDYNCSTSHILSPLHPLLVRWRPSRRPLRPDAFPTRASTFNTFRDFVNRSCRDSRTLCKCFGRFFFLCIVTCILTEVLVHIYVLVVAHQFTVLDSIPVADRISCSKAPRFVRASFTWSAHWRDEPVCPHRV